MGEEVPGSQLKVKNRRERGKEGNKAKWNTLHFFGNPFGDKMDVQFSNGCALGANGCEQMFSYPFEKNGCENT